jgi:hypothetical protein
LGIPVVKPMIKSIYCKLETDLVNAADYEPILMLNYAPLQKFNRYNYHRRVQFTFDIQRLRLTKPYCFYVWKVPKDLPVDHESKVSQLTRSLSAEKNLINIKQSIKQLLTQTYSEQVSFSALDYNNISSFIDTGAYTILILSFNFKQFNFIFLQIVT